MHLAADARLHVAAERGVGQVRVVVVNPDPIGLDPGSDAVRGVGLARPNARAEAKHRVVCAAPQAFPRVSASRTSSICYHSNRQLAQVDGSICSIR